MMRERPVDTALIDRLSSALKHRGPDGSGRYISGTVGFAHTRLAIIDLQTGDQPFFEKQGAVLIANGEIYNDPELRNELRDVPFATRSDCETPLHLYRRHGTNFVNFLRGMYAIAIHDPAANRLVLSRDPFGIKPLYFVETPQCFAFASEPQALLAAGFGARSVRRRALAELLQLKFTTGADTIFPGIYRLLPGETIVVANGRVTERHRRNALIDGAPCTKDYDDALRRLDSVLADSVAHHLRSDVPYGLFLSGGIDSATLAGLTARLGGNPLVAFTAAFPGSAAADEGPYAEKIARSVGAEHHVIEMTAKDFWDDAPRVAAALDDPTTDAATLPTFALARAAKGHLKVVLTGEGGDEIFCGYSRYHRARRMWGMFARKARMRGEFDRLGPMNGVVEGWRDGLEAAERQQAHEGRSFIQILQANDCAEWLPNDLLIKVDRCLMAHGLEGRTPFLDPVVADFAFRLPDEMKATPKISKRMLRDWCAINVPAAEPYARKTGFNPPVGGWIAENQPMAENLVARQPGIREIFTPDFVSRVFRDPGKNHQAAWSLLFYALWHSHHILELPCDGSVKDVLAEAAATG